MFNRMHSSKIKNDKIHCTRLEISSFSFGIIYRPDSLNKVTGALSKVCRAVTSDGLSLHKFH